VAARPSPGGVLVFVADDPTLLLAAAHALGFDALGCKEFEPASGILVEYPPEGPVAAAAAAKDGDEGWVLHRMVSHE